MRVPRLYKPGLATTWLWRSRCKRRIIIIDVGKTIQVSKATVYPHALHDFSLLLLFCFFCILSLNFFLEPATETFCRSRIYAVAALFAPIHPLFQETLVSIEPVRPGPNNQTRARRNPRIWSVPVSQILVVQFRSLTLFSSGTITTPSRPGEEEPRVRTVEAW